MRDNKKTNLMEATVLALSGRLNLNESLDIELGDNGTTFVETDDATVLVQQKCCPEVEAAVVELPVQEVEISDEVIETEPEIETVDEETIDETEEVIEESKKLQETGEWDDSDPEMKAWLNEMERKANTLAEQVNGSVVSVSGFDKYQGPKAIINTPVYGDIELWYDGEDDSGLSFNCDVPKVGWISGNLNRLADLLQREQIPENEILDESACGFKNNKGKEKKEEVGAAAMLGAAALAGLAPAVTKRVQDVLGSVPGSPLGESKEDEIVIEQEVFHKKGKTDSGLDYYENEKGTKVADVGTGKELYQEVTQSYSDDELKDLTKRSEFTFDEIKEDKERKYITITDEENTFIDIHSFDTSKLDEDKEDMNIKTLSSKQDHTKHLTEDFESDLKAVIDLKDDGLYGYVANNYSTMNREVLKEIALNAIYELGNDAKIINHVAERLNETKAKFSSKTFNKAIESYLKENSKIVESFKLSKLSRSQKGLKIEGVITTPKAKRNVVLEFNKLLDNGKFTRYQLVESKQLKLIESKENSKIVMVTNNKNNVLECKFMKKNKLK